MNDAEFWRLVAEFLAAQQSIPGDPSAAVGGDPTMMQDGNFGAIGPYNPGDYDPMGDTQFGPISGASPAVFPNDPSEIGYSTPGAPAGRPQPMGAYPNYAPPAAQPTPWVNHGDPRVQEMFGVPGLMGQMQKGLQQHYQHPNMQPSQVQIERSSPQRPRPMPAPTPEPRTNARQVVRTLTQRPVAQPVPRPAPAPVPMARPMPNAVRRSR